jgi:hypothetical protein
MPPVTEATMGVFRHVRLSLLPILALGPAPPEGPPAPGGGRSGLADADALLPRWN